MCQIFFKLKNGAKQANFKIFNCSQQKIGGIKKIFITCLWRFRAIKKFWDKIYTLDMDTLSKVSN